MKIAFDVKGTLDSPKKNILVSLINWLQKNGHECVVWSNSYMYAVECVKNNDLKCETMSKATKGDFRQYDKDEFDWAIEDDRSQTWLAAKNFLWVDEIETTGWCLIKMGLKEKSK
jgi:hypothetical protein